MVTGGMDIHRHEVVDRTDMVMVHDLGGVHHLKIHILWISLRL